jgi:uncharacterized damage-inducible protein DinB
MRLEEHRRAYGYSRWANEQAFAAAAVLGEEALGRDLGSSFPSILETVRHFVAAEWVWLRRWKGESPVAMPDRLRLAGFDGIRAIWREVAAEQAAFVDALKETDLDVEIGYRNFRGDELAFPLWHMLRHVVNHSSYHRGQVTTMIRQLGAAAVATDMIGHLDD